MWSSCKAFNSIVTDVLVNNRVDQLMEFETVIKRHRSDLLSFPMHKESKSAKDRQLVTRADVEAISIPGLSQKILLTRDLIEETCKLSDLFNLNEITTLELLLTAEGHLTSQSSTLSRLSLAISLYYDAHSLLSNALRTLIRHRIGRVSSNSPLSRDIEDVVTSFTDDLWKNGLLENLLSFLRSFNTIEEYKKLDTARMIEGRRHRYDILHHFAAIRSRIAECIMLWAAQTPFSSGEFNQLLTHLVDFQMGVGEARRCPDDETAPLDHGSIHLLMALLCSLEPFSTPGITADQYSDADEQDLQHPLYWEKGYISTMTDLLTSSGDSKHKNYPLAVEGIYGLLQIAWGITLRRTAHLRADLRRRRGGDSGDTGIDAGDSVDDDELVTTALRSRALFLLFASVLGASHFQQESMWVRRVHNLLTELLINFPQNVRELRLWDESMVRRMGVDPGGFAVLLGALCRLYDVPGSPLHARLSLEFWWPAGETRINATANATAANVAGAQVPQMSEGGSAAAALNASFRAGEVENSRQAILFRFVYSTSEFASSPVIFVPYVKVLRALVGCQTSANLCFNLLKATATSGGRLASLLTWDHFITSLHQYLDHLKRAAAAAAAVTSIATTVGGQHLPPHLQYPHLYASSSDVFSPPSSTEDALFIQQQQLVNQHVQPMDMQQQHQQSSTPLTPEIQPEELDALRSVVGLITRVCFMDPVARSAFSSNTKWSLVSTAIGLITCPLPMSMKADLLHLLAALGRTPSIASEIWCALVESQLLAFIDPQSMMTGANGSINTAKGIIGLHTEMDKAEARQEEYPITQAFLNLLTTLAPSLLSSSVGVNEPSLGGLDPCEALSRLVHFTSENIFLKHTMRAYRQKNERWEIAAACLTLFEGLIQAFLRRMRAVAILAAGSANCSEEQLTLFDWSTLLTGGQLKTTKLKIPRGWPFTDPGYQFVTQLLTNSSLFALMTGLLEVGFYRMIEYDMTHTYAMNRTTGSILRIFEHILPHEQILVNLVRRASLLVPHLRPETAWGQRSGADIIMPSLLSRLLVVTINSRTGRADLLITIVRYCGLSNDLPDHCSSALNILYNVVKATHTNEPVLAILTNDQKTEKELLRALVSCLSSSLYDMTACYESSSIADGESPPIFSDSWLYEDASDESVDGGYNLAATCVYAPHPAFKTAHLLASFPTVRGNWTTEEISRWEFMTTFTATQCDAVSEIVKGSLRELDSMWSFGSSKRLVRSTMLHMILYSLTNNSAPSIGHWLLGFRCKNARTIALTTIQDAGVGGYPRTCLHAILDLIELGVASLRENLVAETIDTPPHISFLTQQWDTAMAWQILYHLMAASTTTSVPMARYLRGNHDFVARHLTTGLVGVFLASSSSCDSLENASGWTLQSLILNQCSWLLKIGAIEVQASTSQRTYLARILTNLFTIGENSPGTNGTVGASFINHFTSSITYSDLTEPQNRVLADLLSRMTLSETLTSPQWIFDRDCVDSKFIEDIVIACEEAFPLISAEEQATLRSGVINISSLVSRLSLFLNQVGSVNTAVFEEGTDAATLALSNLRLCADVVEWARRRNTHRLALVVGKQACLEGWRHLTEIGLRMLHFLARTSPDALSIGTNIPVNRSLYSVTMVLLNALLYEVSAPESAPAVLKVLASGSALNFSAFLQLFASPTSADGLMLLSPRTGGVQSIVAVTQLLLEAILTSKPNQQRVRANYYGALCYILDVCHQFDQQMSASTAIGASEVPIALQSINILAGIDGDDFSNSFLTVLFNDISSGHHPIIPISALGLLCNLIRLDRTSGQVLETVVRDGCLQFCIDSLEDDLNVLQQYLVSQVDNSIVMGRDVNENKEQMDATAVFYIYQSKMALLTLIASTQLGAKAIIQTPLLDSTLCRFEPLSGSCVADVFDFSVASLRNNSGASNTSQSDPLNWLDTHEFSQHLLGSLNRQERGEYVGCSAFGVINPLVTSQLLSASGSSLGVTADPGQCLTWSGILSPALAFTKTLVFTLGPTHVSAVQKVSKFVYTHSEALLTVGASATAARLVTALTQEAFQDYAEGSGTSIERQEQLIQATLQWLHGEESLTHLLSFILRARIPLSLGEPEDLPRELLRGKILRHIFAIMPDSLQALQIKEQRGALTEANPANNVRQTFVRNLVTTKQLELLCLQVNTCVAAVSIEDEFDGLDSTLMKNLIFSSSLISNDTGNEVTPINPARPGLSLLFQLASWVSSRLHHLESQVNSLSRHLPANLFNNTATIPSDFGSSEGGRKKEEGKNASVPALDKVLRCLVQLPVNFNSPGGDISTDSLRQIATNVFSIWSPIVFPLLQTNGTAGGVDTGQRNAFLRRLISLGGGLLQSQLSCFVDILEQSSYLLWRHLACFLASAVKPEAQNDFVSSAPRQTPRRFVDTNFIEQLPRKLTFDLLDSIAQISKAPYLSSSDQLFLQVMAQRLERLSQTRNRVAASEQVSA